MMEYLIQGTCVIKEMANYGDMPSTGLGNLQIMVTFGLLVSQREKLPH